MSNEIQIEELESKEIKGTLEENKDGEQENILEKINRQIEFLKNKFEVTKMVDNSEHEDNKVDLKKEHSNIINFQDNKNNEIIKAIQDENNSLKNQMNQKEKLLKNLMEEMEKKKNLIDNLIKEVEKAKKDKLELETNFQNYISNSNMNFSREFLPGSNDIRHLKNKDSMYSINTLSTGFSHKDYLNIQSENEKLQKEKAAMESQLVIYKLKYAESSSSLMEAEDLAIVLKKKNDDLVEKLKVKDEIIKNLVSERDNIREAYFSNSITNRTETLQNYQTSCINTNNVSITQRNPSESNYSNYHTAGGSKISITQLQNKDKQMRKMTNTILENNSNKSILSRNTEGYENRNIFDFDKSSITEENNNKQNNKDYNYTKGIGIGNENLSIKTNNNNTARKSAGFMGSIKNLFGDKNKRTTTKN